MSRELLNVLLVEDNCDHAELVKRSLSEHEVPNRFFHVSDGEEALDYLFARGAFSDRGIYPSPQVVLLDLRLPKIDGLNVLREIKASPATRRIPVVVLTTSNAEPDVGRSYDLHANSYLVKPIDHRQFTRLIYDVGNYWLSVNEPPPAFSASS